MYAAGGLDKKVRAVAMSDSVNVTSHHAESRERSDLTLHSFKLRIILQFLRFGTRVLFQTPKRYVMFLKIVAF